MTTRTGDEGYTDLLGNQRVAKYDSRPEAYGEVDEASSALGLARSLVQEQAIKDEIYQLQQDLYLMMAELATPAENYDKVEWKMTPEHVARLDLLGERLKADVEIGKHFIVPGSTVPGAALDVARSVIRRAERRVVRLFHEGVIGNAEVVRYLNRLSDVVFIMARWVEREAAA